MEFAHLSLHKYISSGVCRLAVLILLIPFACRPAPRGELALDPEVASKSRVAIIDTLAGGGPVGDGGPAKSARLNLPGGVTVAPNGDLIVVDFGNHRVRCIDHQLHVIRAVAGTGDAGYNGDNIPAFRAQLARPEYAVFGPAGDLFIADSYNNRIRRIDHHTGLISTVAGNGERGFSGDGGPAKSAKLHFPEGLAVDVKGNLFIADTVNRRIRRVDVRTGIISTYAGIGEVGVNAEGTTALRAHFLRLARIAVDRAGNIYVADSPAHRILKIDATTRLLRTFAGTGRSGFSGDGGLASNAQLQFPEGVVVAPNQDVYFADVGNQRIRRIDARTNIISTIAGTGEKGFSGDGGPAVKARLRSPGRVWVDRDSNVLIADILNARIRRVDAKTGTIETIVGSGDWGDGGPARDAILSIPGDVVYSEKKVYIADYGTQRIRCVDLTTGLISTVAGGGLRHGDGIPASDAELLLPEGIAVDSLRGVLYIADNISNKVWEVNLKSGILRTFAGGGAAGEYADGVAAVSGHLYLPSAVAVGAGALVYIADFGDRTVRVVNAETGTMTTLHDANNRKEPLDMAVTSLDATPKGLFLLTQESSEVRFFDPRDSTFSTVEQIDGPPSALSGDSQIIDVAVKGPYVYLADALGHRVLCLDLRTSAVSVVAGSGVQGYSGDGGPAERASLFQPGGVTVSDDGNELFIADTKNHRIRRVRFLAAKEPK